MQKPNPEDDEKYAQERETAQHRKIDESMTAKRKPPHPPASQSDYDPHRW